jgi:hypothetical protein
MGVQLWGSSHSDARRVERARRSARSWKFVGQESLHQDTLLVQRLKLLCPLMGKVRIAQVLARAGLQLAPRTVRRLLDRASCPEPEPAVARSARHAGRCVIARYSDHVWSIDHTVVPTRAGLWVPWIPFSLVQRWPFCHWVSVVLDHFSRRVMPNEVYFGRKPACTRSRFEPRARYPAQGRRARRGVKLKLVVAHFEGSNELPIVQLRWAA